MYSIVTSAQFSKVRSWLERPPTQMCQRGAQRSLDTWDSNLCESTSSKSTRCDAEVSCFRPLNLTLHVFRMGKYRDEWGETSVWIPKPSLNITKSYFASPGPVILSYLRIAPAPTHRPRRSSLLWLILLRILRGNPKKELLRGLWVPLT